MKYIAKHWVISLVFSLILAALIVLAVLAFGDFSYMMAEVSTRDILKVEELTKKRVPFQEFSDYFAEVATDKGAVYAYELMKTAELPFGLDQHLLGHVVGDILYEQEGVDGMKYCTHEFRNACSHTIVIGALIEYGTGAFPKINEACKAAPGGKGAYTMCYHGLGHGVLAFNGYDMDNTVAMCELLSTKEYNNREGVECFGGAIMEIIGGGGHDKETWEIKREEYLDPENPFGLCQGDIVPREYKSMCYNYMTPYAFESFGADMAYPDPEIYEQTFELCDRILATDSDERRSCFGGLGKEFIGIATGRNFTPGYEPTKEQLERMLDWCNLAKPEDGRQYCILSTMDSLYWGGEKPYETALAFCSMVEESKIASECFGKLIWSVSFYIDDFDYYTSFCGDLPEAYRADCTQKLSL